MFDLELEGKVALVTGASDGLGYATAMRLAQEGARVAVCARRAGHLATAAQSIREATGAEVFDHAADVTEAEDIEGLVNAVVAAFGGIDILVNNAGTSAAAGLEAVDDDGWHVDIELKIMAAVRLCRRVIPMMCERGGGAVVNAAIGAGKAAPAGALPTSVTRAAGINLTKSLANEYASRNVRVNAVCIGLIESAQWERRADGGNRTVEALYEELGARIPMGRVGRASEYADLVAYLVSARASYVTGTAVNVDGGLCPVV